MVGRQAAQIEDFVAAARRRHPARAMRFERDRAAPRRAGTRGHSRVHRRHRGAERQGRVACRERQRAGRTAGRADDRDGARRPRERAHHRSSDGRVGAGSRARVRGGARAPSARYTSSAGPSADGQRAKATAVMEDMLQAHRDSTGVFGINDDSALGALAVVEAAGAQDIVIVGYDATDEAQAAMRKGRRSRPTSSSTRGTIGKTAMDVIARYLTGEHVPPIVVRHVGVRDGGRPSATVTLLHAPRRREGVRRRACTRRTSTSSFARAKSTRSSARTAPASRR